MIKKLNQKGATMVEMALVGCLALTSLLFIMYLWFVISFSSGLGHSLSIGIKVAQDSMDNIIDIYNPNLAPMDYDSFDAWRSNLIFEINRTGVSFLQKAVYSYKNLEVLDDTALGSVWVPTSIALVLPGSAVKVYDPSDATGQTFKIFTHSSVCPRASTGVACDMSTKIRRTNQTLKDLLKIYPAEFQTFPYLTQMPGIAVAPVIAAGYLAPLDAQVVPNPSTSLAASASRTANATRSRTNNSPSGSPAITPSNSPAVTPSNSPAVTPASTTTTTTTSSRIMVSSPIIAD